MDVSLNRKTDKWRCQNRGKNMDKLPVVCKYTYSYKYNKKVKEKPLYALLLEYSPVQNAYYANLFEQNGKLHGRYYDRWLNWDEDTIVKYTVSMDSLPGPVLKRIKEQISIFEEVNNRCKYRGKYADTNTV